MDKKIKGITRYADLEIKRKDEEEWQALEERISHHKVGEIRETLKRLADFYGGYWAKWKNLQNIAPKTVYDEWWRENHDKPIKEALERLEVKVRGKECRARDCDNVFVPKRSDQIYCSKRCAKRVWAQKHLLER